jgi:anaphase-promoting complex subunit 8
MTTKAISSPFLSPGGMAISPRVNMELEIAWNPAQVSADLQKACQILSERGLKLAAKWAAEQWMGIAPEMISDTVAESSISDSLLMNDQRNTLTPAVFYAKTLLELGEYAAAAAALSQPSHDKLSTVETMPPPLLDLTPFAFYLRAYALYMAGERRKEEEYLELKRYVDPLPYQ